ncbi:MAG: hypothetical protein IKJ77_00240 [Firmicutes bacterium]|nr:hypothetical protein [Bacillota bacterium]
MKLNIPAIKIGMATMQLNQKLLADKVNVSQNAISLAFRKERASTILTGKIANALDMSVSEITIKEYATKEPPKEPLYR